MQVTIGTASFAFDGQALTVTSVSEPHLSVRTRLESRHVEELVDFLHALPSEGDDRRNAFRVSIAKGTGVEVKLHKNGTALVCEPRDISLVGMRVAIEPRAQKHLALEDELVVSLAFEDQGLELAGRIKRLEPDNCGILFVEAVRGGDVAPPPALAKLVMELQRRWLTDMTRRSAP